MDANVYQVISASATMSWQTNFATYGNEFQVRGWIDWPPEGDWPPEY